MTRNIDQAPQNPNQQPTPNNQPPVHPEHIQDGFFSTPAHNGERRDRINDINTQKNKRNVKIIAGISGAALAVVIGGGFAAIKGAEAFGGAAGNKVASDLMEDEGSGTNPKVDIDNNTVTIDKQFDSKNETVQYAIDNLKKYEDESISYLEGKGYSIDIGSNEETDTPQQIIDRHAVNVYSVWKVAQTDPDEAKRLLSGFVNPDSGQYEYLEEITTDGGSAIDSTAAIIDASDIFKQTKFQTVKPNGLATRIITFQYNLDGEVYQSVFQQAKGTKDGESGWVMMQQEYADFNNNPRFVDDIQGETSNFN